MLKLGEDPRETTPRGDIAAVIDMRPDGRPMRAVSPGPGVRPSGIYASQKSGRGHPWESKLELHDLWRAEVEWEVVESWCQPCRIWLDNGHKAMSYVPDRKDRLADGAVEYVEVKPKFDPNKDAAYTEKLLKAEAILTGLGHRFRIVERAEIEAEPAYSAIKMVQRHRRSHVDPIALRRIQDRVGHGGSAPRGAMQDMMGGPLDGLPAICALIVQRHLRFDPNDGFGPDALISLGRETGG